jgi:hypothetical protein
MGDEPRFEATLEAAERVVQVLLNMPAEALLIGGLALAVHHHPRDSDRIDVPKARPHQTALQKQTSQVGSYPFFPISGLPAAMGHGKDEQMLFVRVNSFSNGILWV